MSNIPYETWQPLTLKSVLNLFQNAPFQWCIAGGYAIETFLGIAIRSHSDIDVTIFRDEQIALQKWLSSWELFAADPPGTLRRWKNEEYLSIGIHDIWGHQPNIQAWQLQVMLTEVDGEEWFSRRNRLICGKRNELYRVYHDIPCIRPEIQLLYKAKAQRPKDEQDFHACLPKLDDDAKAWLKDKLLLLYPNGHDWLALLD